MYDGDAVSSPGPSRFAVWLSFCHPPTPAQFFLEEDASGRSHGLWAPGSWPSVTFHVGSVLGAGVPLLLDTKPLAGEGS